MKKLLTLAAIMITFALIACVPINQSDNYLTCGSEEYLKAVADEDARSATTITLKGGMVIPSGYVPMEIPCNPPVVDDGCTIDCGPDEPPECTIDCDPVDPPECTIDCGPVDPPECTIDCDPVDPPVNEKCNSGRGNGDEGCDPGNSGVADGDGNEGGDEDSDPSGKGQGFVNSGHNR